MPGLNELLFVAAALLFGGIVLGALSSRLGVPLLLVFLCVGMVAGEDGPGRIDFDDYRLVFLIGNLALAVILLDGGLRTKFGTFRVALSPSLTLATFGVALTAVLVAVAAHLLFDFDWRVAMLLGAIIGSTDAAAVFALLRSSGVRLNDRIAATLEIESGVNDPMAIFLTLLLVEAILQPAGLGVQRMLLEFGAQLTLGVIGGLAAGRVLSAVIGRLPMTEGLQALLICSGGVGTFALTNLAGGSGFLAVYLVGLVVGNRKHRAGEDVLRAMDGMAWLAQSGMFLLLGLLVTPSEILASLGPALGLTAVLIFVARPVAVGLSLLPFRFPWRESAFIGWVGLRGAVPIVLALFPLLAGVPQAPMLFNVAFVVVLGSLLLQGMTIRPVARLLRVAMPRRAEAAVEVMLSDARTHLFEFVVDAGSGLDGASVHSVVPPGEAYVAAALRDGRPIGRGENPLRAGDRLLVVGDVDAIDEIAEYLARRAEAGTSEARQWFGDFEMDASASLDEVVALYGDASLPESGQSVADALAVQLPRPVVGDEAVIGGVRFSVREMHQGDIVRVGVRLPRHAAATHPSGRPLVAPGRPDDA